MMRTETAERSGSSRGIFRDLDDIAPAGSLFRQEEPAAGGTERYHVSAADDPEEIRAEHTADQVVGGGSIFREADGRGAGGGEVGLPWAALAGPGSPLPAGIQQAMGASMGADFSGVRVHTGAGADRASRGLSARAFARGQDLYFRGGEYNPGSQEGQHLIAHELAHVADGADGLHRVFKEPDFPELEYDDGEKELVRNVGKICNAINGPTVKPLASVTKNEVENAKAGLDYADDYCNQITIAKRSTVEKDGDSPEATQAKAKKRAALESQYNRLQEALQNRPMIEQLLAQFEKKTDNDDAISEPVKDMINSPFFDAFFKAASQIQKAGKSAGFQEAEERAAGQVGVDNSMSLMAMKEKKDYMEGFGIAEQDDSLGKWGERLSSISEASGELSGDIGSVASAAKLKNSHEAIEKDSTLSTEEKQEKTAEADEANESWSEGVAGAMDSVTNGLEGIGASLSAAQSAKDAKAQQQQNMRAQQAMKKIGSQLAGTFTLTDAERASLPDAKKRLGKLDAVCTRLEQADIDNLKKGQPGLSDLIAAAMDESLAPALTEKQRGLLTSLLALENGRASSKNQASRLKKEAIFGSMDAIGAGMKSLGSMLSSIGAFSGSEKTGLAGAIFSMLGTLSKVVGGLGRGEMPGDDSSPEDEKLEKLMVCRSAVQQMTALPAIPDDAMGALKDRVNGNANNPAKPVSAMTIAGAEQYAAVFFSIESANVNMGDLLYAIEKGEFGKETTDAQGNKAKKSAADSLNDMYKNLSFS